MNLELNIYACVFAAALVYILPCTFYSYAETKVFYKIAAAGCSLVTLITRKVFRIDRLNSQPNYNLPAFHARSIP